MDEITVPTLGASTEPPKPVVAFNVPAGTGANCVPISEVSTSTSSCDDMERAAMRDWFAVRALPEMMRLTAQVRMHEPLHVRAWAHLRCWLRGARGTHAAVQVVDHYPTVVAAQAYLYADAMLRERDIVRPELPHGSSHMLPDGSTAPGHA